MDSNRSFRCLVPEWDTRSRTMGRKETPICNGSHRLWVLNIRQDHGAFSAWQDRNFAGSRKINRPVPEVTKTSWAPLSKSRHFDGTRRAYFTPLHHLQAPTLFLSDA